MGGMGSGRRYQGGKDTTSDMRALDVRRLQRDGLLTPGRAFGWNWSRNGETVASIQMRTEDDRVMRATGGYSLFGAGVRLSALPEAGL